MLLENKEFMHSDNVMLVISVPQPVEILQNSNFHARLVIKGSLVFYDLHSYNFTTLLANAFCHLSKCALSQHVTDNIPARMQVVFSLSTSTDMGYVLDKPYLWSVSDCKAKPVQRMRSLFSLSYPPLWTPMLGCVSVLLAAWWVLLPGERGTAMAIHCTLSSCDGRDVQPCRRAANFKLQGEVHDLSEEFLIGLLYPDVVVVELCTCHVRTLPKRARDNAAISSPCRGCLLLRTRWESAI